MVAEELEINHEVPCREVCRRPGHGQLYIHIVGLLGNERAIVEGGNSGRTDTEAILQVDWFGQVDGRNVTVVEEEIGCR